MYYGIKTGLNEAFIIDTATRDALVARDARSAEILKPILKGEDLRPWYQDWDGNWLVFARRGIRIEEYPAVLAYLEGFREQLEPRPQDWKGTTDSWPGRKPGSYKWYELQDSIDYHAEFEQPKIFWPDIQKLPRYSFDTTGFLVNDTGCVIASPASSSLAALQSRSAWFAFSQIAMPLRLRGGLWQYRSKVQFVERLPIPPMPSSEEPALSALALEITALARERHGLHTKTRKRIATDLAADGGKLNNALTAWWALDFKTFRGEVNKALKNDIPVREREDWEAALRDWRGEHERLTARIVALEEEMNDRVYRLFGLTRGDISTLEDFMKRTKTLYPLGEV